MLVENHWIREKIGIVKSKETQPGVFIGSCLVESDDYICPIVINTTIETIEISTPSVTLDAVQLGDAAEMLVLHKSDDRTVQSRQECVHKLLRIEHLLHEEKKTLTQICSDFCDIFHVEDGLLTYITTTAHEMNTRNDSAPVNVRPYRLPEKHKAKINRQIEKMMTE
ncbi:hypothetical protein P5V15_014103 [Pogonomyrmex californicus]